MLRVARRRREGVRRRGRVACRSPRSRGSAIRVIVDARQGYAWAGSLDADVVADTVAEARDNAAFGAPDESYALATPADVEGVDPPTLDLWRDDVLRTPDRRQGGARARARGRDHATPTRASAASSRRPTATPRSKPRWRTRSASRRRPVARCARAPRSRWRGRAPPPRPAAASRPGGASPRSTRDVAAHDAAERAGAPARARSRSRRRTLPVVLRPAGHPLGARVARRRALGRGDREGPFAVRRPRR